MIVKNVTRSPVTLLLSAPTKDGVQKFSTSLLGKSETEVDVTVTVENLDILWSSGQILVDDRPYFQVAADSAIEVKEVIKEKKPEPVKSTAEDSRSPFVEIEPISPVLEAPVPEVTEVAPLVTETPLPPLNAELVCKVCGQEYATERGLKAHVAKIHNA